MDKVQKPSESEFCPAWQRSLRLKGVFNLKASLYTCGYRWLATTYSDCFTALTNIFP